MKGGFLVMEVTKTIKNKITSHNDKTFTDTIIIFREALGFIIDVVNKEWVTIAPLSNKDALTTVEMLIHRTKKNPSPKYDFTTKFYKFPSYFRRAAINKAVGIVSSYQSNTDNWVEERMNAMKEGKVFTKKPPALSLGHQAFPTFYKGNMFVKIDETHANIKVYKNSDWVWETVTFKKKNMRNRHVKTAVLNAVEIKWLNLNLKKAKMKFKLKSKMANYLQRQKVPSGLQSNTGRIKNSHMMKILNVATLKE